MKRCDKGAGIIILDFEEYKHACYAHLNSRQTHADGSTRPYYMKVDETALEDAEAKLNAILEEALDNKIISKSEFNAMSPADKKAAKFYMTFKVHKEHIHVKAPPERPICSGCGSIYKNVTKFIEHHIKHYATSHDTYIEDTPNF